MYRLKLDDFACANPATPATLLQNQPVITGMCSRVAAVADTCAVKNPDIAPPTRAALAAWLQLVEGEGMVNTVEWLRSKLRYLICVRNECLTNGMTRTHADTECGLDDWQERLQCSLNTAADIPSDDVLSQCLGKVVTHA